MHSFPKLLSIGGWFVISSTFPSFFRGMKN